NARSELVTPLNFSEGGVCDRTRRFHTAVPGLSVPARKPTRGSGIGSPGDMSLIDGMLLLERAEPVEVAQPAAIKSATPTDSEPNSVVRRSRCTASMCESSGGSERNWWTAKLLGIDA